MVTWACRKIASVIILRGGTSPQQSPGGSSIAHAVRNGLQ